jgi:hypothetical protein
MYVNKIEQDGLFQAQTVGTANSQESPSTIALPLLQLM